MQKIKKSEIKGYLDFLNDMNVSFNELSKTRGSKAVIDSFYDNLMLYRRTKIIKNIQNNLAKRK